MIQGKVMSLFKKIDIYGNKLRIEINEENTVKTSLGGILAVMSVIVMIAVSWLVGKDIVLRANPSSCDQKFSTQNYPEISINATSFPFALAVLDPSSNPVYNSKIFKLKTSYKHNVLNDQGVMVETTTDIELGKCTYDHFPSLAQSDFDTSSLATLALCPINQNYTLKGYWNENELYWLDFTLALCDYDSDQTCATYDEMVSYFETNSLSLNIFYVDKFVEVLDFLNPVKNYVNSISMYIKTDMMKITSINVNSQSILTDLGLLFEDNQSINYLGLSLGPTDIANFNKSTKELTTVKVFSSNVSEQMHRQYIKIPQVLANIGGMLHVVTVLFKLINYHFSWTQKYLKILNSIYDDKLFDHSETKSSSGPGLGYLNSNLKIADLTKRNDYNEMKSQDISIRSNSICEADTSKVKSNEILQEHIINKYLESRRNFTRKTLEMNYCSQFALLFYSINCCRSCVRQATKRKINTFDIGVARIKPYFDFINIIRKLEEFELFKNLLFTDNQRNIFKIATKCFIEGGKQNYENEIGELKLLLKNISLSDDPLDVNLYKLFLKVNGMSGCL